MAFRRCRRNALTSHRYNDAGSPAIRVLNFSADHNWCARPLEARQAAFDMAAVLRPGNHFLAQVAALGETDCAEFVKGQHLRQESPGGGRLQPDFAAVDGGLAPLVKGQRGAFSRRFADLPKPEAEPSLGSRISTCRSSSRFKAGETKVQADGADDAAAAHNGGAGFRER